MYLFTVVLYMKSEKRWCLFCVYISEWPHYGFTHVILAAFTVVGFLHEKLT